MLLTLALLGLLVEFKALVTEASRFRSNLVARHLVLVIAHVGTAMDLCLQFSNNCTVRCV